MDAVSQPTRVSQVELTSEGPEVVLGALFERDYARLLAVARLLVDDGGDAEEVVQEAFTRVFANWDRVSAKHDPSAYVRRTVINLATGRLRRRLTVRRHRPEHANHARAAEDVALARDHHDAVLQAIRLLPRRQRECVLLRYFVECSTEETAEIIGVTTGSVKTHLHRALAALAVTLEETRT